MDARYPILLGCAAGALVLATPAAAQEIPYEYTHPAPPQPEVVFRHDPVVQPIPETDPDVYAQPAQEPRYEYEYRREAYEAPVEAEAPMQPPFEWHEGPPPPPYAGGPDHREAMAAHHYRHGGHPGPAPYPAPYAAYGYGYGAAYGYPVMLVPVLIQVPQRAVVHEYVTEEWVEEAAAPAPARRRVQHRAAPKPAKPVKYVKGR